MSDGLRQLRRKRGSSIDFLLRQPGAVGRRLVALVCRGRISIFKQPFGSEGTIENSPAFQCRDRLGKSRVPQGRLKRNVFSGVPAGLVTIPSNPGVQTPGYFSRRGGIPLGHSVSVVQKLRCARLPANRMFVLARCLRQCYNFALSGGVTTISRK